MSLRDAVWNRTENDLLTDVIIAVMRDVYDKFYTSDCSVKTANGTLNRLLSPRHVHWIREYEWEHLPELEEEESLNFEALHTMFSMMHTTKAYLNFAERNQRNGALMRSETNQKHLDLIEYSLSILEDCMRVAGGTPPYQILLKWLCSRKVHKRHKELIVYYSCVSLRNFKDVESCFWWFLKMWMPAVYAANKELVLQVLNEKFTNDPNKPMLEAAFNIHELPQDSLWRDPSVVNIQLQMSEEERRITQERQRHQEILQYLYSLNELRPEEAN